MKKYKAHCDGGCLQIGNDTFNLKIPNGYGDCGFPVLICTEKEFVQDIPNSRNFRWMGCAEGEFNIYAYDCDKDEILDTVKGRYGIYLLTDPCDFPTFALVKKKEIIPFRVWKYASRPFTFGGSCRDKISTTISIDHDEIVRHEGFDLIPITVNDRSYVFDAYSGGLVGDTIDQVKKDIDSCEDKNFIKEQIKSEKVNGESAIHVSKEEFFSNTFIAK